MHKGCRVKVAASCTTQRRRRSCGWVMQGCATHAHLWASLEGKALPDLLVTLALCFHSCICIFPTSTSYVLLFVLGNKTAVLACFRNFHVYSLFRDSSVWLHGNVDYSPSLWHGVLQEKIVIVYLPTCSWIKFHHFRDWYIALVSLLYAVCVWVELLAYSQHMHCLCAICVLPTVFQSVVTKVLSPFHLLFCQEAPFLWENFHFFIDLPMCFTSFMIIF